MSDGERPDTPAVPAVSPGSRQRIHISNRANDLLAQWSEDLLLGRLEVWHLPSGLQTFYDRAFWDGWRVRQDEVNRLACEVARANDDADRFYRHAFEPGHRLKPAPASYADMERRRGNPERAEQYEQFLNDLFAHFGGNSPTPPPKNGLTY